MQRESKPQAKDDPKITPLGTHPVSTAVGTVTGAVTGGAVAGSAAGPIGTAVGAAVGAAVGGVGGKLIADVVDPQMEKEFWRKALDEPGQDLEAVQRARDLGEPDPNDESK